MNQFSLENNVAIVTGAAHGIGKAIAETFAQAGAAVMIADLDLAAAEQTAGSIVSGGGNAAAMKCDVTDPESLQALVDTTLERFGKITLLVNNAGGGGPQPFDMPPEKFEAIFNLNVFSIFRLSQLCVPHMKAQGGGAILNISSMSAENKNKRMTAYGASKAAVSHLTRNLAFDVGEFGIRVNGIAPGAIKTAALMSVLNADIEANMLKHTPLKRLGEAEDIANGALFLCSPAASWVSGQILTISGGGTQELD